MNNEIDQEKLLDDVLSESVPAEFRKAMLGETLRLARRRRQGRILRRAGGVAALVLLVISFAIHIQTGKVNVPPAVVESPAISIYQLVSTAPSAPGFEVETRNGEPVQEFATVTNVTQIATVTENFQFIDDNQLLAFSPHLPKVLIRTGPDTAEMVFAYAKDNLTFNTSERQ